MHFGGNCPNTQCGFFLVGCQRFGENFLCTARLLASDLSCQLLRSAHTRGLVPATSRCNKSREVFSRRDWLQGLVPRTVYTKLLEELVTGTCLKYSNWCEFVGLVVRLDFEAKMASSHDGTCPRD